MAAKYEYCAGKLVYRGARPNGISGPADNLVGKGRPTSAEKDKEAHHNMAAPAIPVDGALTKLKVEELRTLCGEHGLATTGLKKDLVDRLKEKRDGGVEPPSPDLGGVPPVPLGGPPPDPMEEVEVACGKKPEVIALVRTGIGDGPMLSWVCTAMAQELGAKVEMDTMRELEVGFTSGGVSRTMLAMAVCKSSDHYVPMRNALTEALMSKKELPVGYTVVHAKQAVTRMLEVFTPAAAGGGVGAAGGPDWEALLTRLASGIKEGLASQGREGVSGGSKMTTAEVQEAIHALGEMGYPLDEKDLPRLEQLGKAKSALLAKVGEVARPQLPLEPTTQPRMLTGLQDERGQYVEEETREIVWDEVNQRQISRALSTPSKGYTRTAYSVAQGHLFYWHSVLLIATMIKNLPERPDDDGAETRKKGVWLHPYYVIKFEKMLSTVVGRQTLTGPGLDELLRPLLQEAQHKVNHKGMSGDVALAWIIDEMPVRLATVAASKTENDARKQKEDQPPNKKRKQGEEKEVAKPGQYKRGQTCSTCGGKCSHISGRCFICRSKDKKPQGKVVAADSAKGGAAPGVAAATTASGT